MAVSHLQCKECGASYPLEAVYVCEECFGPLEVAYQARELEQDIGELRRRDHERTAEHLALRRFPAARRRTPRTVGAPREPRRALTGLHAADLRRPTG